MTSREKSKKLLLSREKKPLHDTPPPLTSSHEENQSTTKKQKKSSSRLMSTSHQDLRQKIFGAQNQTTDKKKQKTKQDSIPLSVIIQPSFDQPTLQSPSAAVTSSSHTFGRFASFSRSATLVKFVSNSTQIAPLVPVQSAAHRRGSLSRRTSFCETPPVSYGAPSPSMVYDGTIPSVHSPHVNRSNSLRRSWDGNSGETLAQAIAIAISAVKEESVVDKAIVPLAMISRPMKQNRANGVAQIAMEWTHMIFSPGVYMSDSVKWLDLSPLVPLHKSKPSIEPDEVVDGSMAGTGIHWRRGSRQWRWLLSPETTILTSCGVNGTTSKEITRQPSIVTAVPYPAHQRGTRPLMILDLGAWSELSEIFDDWEGCIEPNESEIQAALTFLKEKTSLAPLIAASIAKRKPYEDFKVKHFLPKNNTKHNSTLLTISTSMDPQHWESTPLVLNISSSPRLDDCLLQQLTKLRPLQRTLHVLDLSYVPKISSSTWISLTSLTSLFSLNLSYNLSVNDNVVIQLISSLPKLMEFRLKGCRQITDASILEISRHMQTRLRVLSVAECDLLTNMSINEVLTHCKRLEELDLTHCVRLTFIGLLIRVPGPVCGRGEGGGSGLAHGLEMIGRSLRCLRVGFCTELSMQSLDWISTALSELVELDISHIHTVTDDILRGIAGGCKQLSSLIVNGCPQVTTSGLAIVANYCSGRLRVLEAALCCDLHFSAEAIANAIGACGRLRDLRLSHNPGFTNDVFSSLSALRAKQEGDDKGSGVQIGRSIQALDVSYTALTSLGVVHLAMVLPNLRLLNVSGLSHMNDAAVQAIARSCTRLESLSLNACPTLTDVAVDAVCYNLRHLATLNLRFYDGSSDLRPAGNVVNPLEMHGLQYTDAIWPAILCGAKNLRSLDLSGQEGLVARSKWLRNIFPGIGNVVLQRLNLAGCSRLDYQGLVIWLRACKAINSVYIPSEWVVNVNPYDPPPASRAYVTSSAYWQSAFGHCTYVLPPPKSQSSAIVNSEEGIGVELAGTVMGSNDLITAERELAWLAHSSAALVSTKKMSLPPQITGSITAIYASTSPSVLLERHRHLRGYHILVPHPNAPLLASRDALIRRRLTENFAARVILHAWMCHRIWQRFRHSINGRRISRFIIFHRRRIHREKILKSAKRVWAQVRIGYWWIKIWLTKKRAALRIEKAWRVHLQYQREMFTRAREAQTVVIQRYVRGWLVRSSPRALLCAAYSALPPFWKALANLEPTETRDEEGRIVWVPMVTVEGNGRQALPLVGLTRQELASLRSSVEETRSHIKDNVFAGRKRLPRVPTVIVPQSFDLRATATLTNGSALAFYSSEDSLFSAAFTEATNNRQITGGNALSEEAEMFLSGRDSLYAATHSAATRQVKAKAATLAAAREAASVSVPVHVYHAVYWPITRPPPPSHHGSDVQIFDRRLSGLDVAAARRDILRCDTCSARLRLVRCATCRAGFCFSCAMIAHASPEKQRHDLSLAPPRTYSNTPLEVLTTGPESKVDNRLIDASSKGNNKMAYSGYGGHDGIKSSPSASLLAHTDIAASAMADLRYVVRFLRTAAESQRLATEKAAAKAFEEEAERARQALAAAQQLHGTCVAYASRIANLWRRILAKRELEKRRRQHAWEVNLAKDAAFHKGLIRWQAAIRGWLIRKWAVELNIVNEKKCGVKEEVKKPRRFLTGAAAGSTIPGNNTNKKAKVATSAQRSAIGKQAVKSAVESSTAERWKSLENVEAEYTSILGLILTASTDAEQQHASLDAPIAALIAARDDAANSHREAAKFLSAGSATNQENVTSTATSPHSPVRTYLDSTEKAEAELNVRLAAIRLAVASERLDYTRQQQWYLFQTIRCYRRALAVLPHQATEYAQRLGLIGTEFQILSTIQDHCDARIKTFSVSRSRTTVGLRRVTTTSSAKNPSGLSTSITNTDSVEDAVTTVSTPNISRKISSPVKTLNPNPVGSPSGASSSNTVVQRTDDPSLLADAIAWLTEQRELSKKQLSSLDATQESIIRDEMERLNVLRSRILATQSLSSEILSALKALTQFAAERVALDIESVAGPYRVALFERSQSSDGAKNHTVSAKRGPAVSSKTAALRSILSTEISRPYDAVATQSAQLSLSLKSRQLGQETLDRLAIALTDLLDKADAEYRFDYQFPNDDASATDIAVLKELTATRLIIKNHSSTSFSVTKWLTLLSLQPWLVAAAVADIRHEEKIEAMRLSILTAEESLRTTDRLIRLTKTRIAELKDILTTTQVELEARLDPDPNETYAEATEREKEIVEAQQIIAESKLELSTCEISLTNLIGEQPTLESRVQRLRKEGKTLEEVLAARLAQREASISAFFSAEEAFVKNDIGRATGALIAAEDASSAFTSLAFTARTAAEAALAVSTEDANNPAVSPWPAVIPLSPFVLPICAAAHRVTPSSLPNVATYTHAALAVRSVFLAQQAQHATTEVEHREEEKSFLTSYPTHRKRLEGRLAAYVAEMQWQKRLRVRDNLLKRRRERLDDMRAIRIREALQVAEASAAAAAAAKSAVDDSLSEAALQGNIGNGTLQLAARKMKKLIRRAKDELRQIKASSDVMMTEDEQRIAAALRSKDRPDLGHRVDGLRRLMFSTTPETTAAMTAQNNFLRAHGLPYFIRSERSLGNNIWLWAESTLDPKRFITHIVLASTNPASPYYRSNLASEGYQRVDVGEKGRWCLWTKADKRSSRGIRRIDMAFDDVEATRLMTDGYEVLEPNLVELDHVDMTLWVLRGPKSRENYNGVNTNSLVAEIQKLKQLQIEHPGDEYVDELLKRCETRLVAALEREKKQAVNDPLTAAVELLALEEDELRKWTQIFHRLDKESTGRVDVVHILSSFDLHYNDLSLAIFKTMDAIDDDGKVEFADFLRAVGAFCFFGREEILRFLFTFIDKTYRGSITESELRSLANIVNPFDRMRSDKCLRLIGMKPGDHMEFSKFTEINERFPSLFANMFAMQAKLRNDTMGSDWWFHKMTSYRNVRNKLHNEGDFIDESVAIEWDRFAEDQKRLARMRERQMEIESTNSEIRKTILQARQVIDELI